jgi:hypothetical protein
VETGMLGENLSSATLAVTDPTRSDMGSNQDRSYREPNTNRLICGLTNPFRRFSSV